MSDTIFNRIQTLKTWKPMEPLWLSTQKIQEYEQKIRDICDYEGCYNLQTEYLIDIEGQQEQIDHNFIKYLARKHVKSILNYIESKGVVLNDIEGNIRLILDEIIKGVVDESYYLNTLDIYDSISGNCYEEPDICKIIDQAVRLNNERILYYILFDQDENMADCVYEITRE